MGMEDERYDGFQMKRLFDNDDPLPSSSAEIRQRFEEYRKALINRTPEQLRQYRKWMIPTRRERFKRFVTPWNYVHLDWTPRKPSLFRRILSLLTQHFKK